MKDRLQLFTKLSSL